ncbi:MAG: hypothetical protein RLZZ383_239, partial [Pseudomonadota bacterium]
HRLPFLAALHVLVASGEAPTEAQMIGICDRQVQVVSYAIPTKEAAYTALRGWLTWLPSAQRAPARVAPKTTLAFADAARAACGASWCTEDDLGGKPWALARAAWRGDSRRPGEGADPLYQRLFPNGPWTDGDDERVASFVEDARAIWGHVAEVLP